MVRVVVFRLGHVYIIFYVQFCRVHVDEGPRLLDLPTSYTTFDVLEGPVALLFYFFELLV